MASVFRHFYSPLTWLTLGAAAIGLSFAAAWRSVSALPRIEEASPAPPPVPSITTEPLRSFTNDMIFSASPFARDQRPVVDLARRFRLAGTFFVLSSDLLQDTRKAVVVARDGKENYIVQEGDVFEDISVAKVGHDYVLLQQDGRQEKLALTTGAGRDVMQTDASLSATKDDEPRKKSPADRFGEQIGEKRWVFERDKLLEYYQEVMRSPQRLQQVFASMQPLYNENRDITGYVLEIAGEKEFFEAVGLREGDIVRHVNNMAMSNRRRAEYLIGEFIYDRLNVFVLDIEREDSKAQLIYEVR